MTPLRLLLAAPVVLLATVGLALVWPAATPPAPRAETSVVSTPQPALDVLRGWDRRRAAAWAAADGEALRRLYVPGSRAGRQDLALLRAYADRGLRVTGLEVQLLAVRVRRASSARLVVDVTDRLAGGVARGGDRPVVLPADRPSQWRVVLRLWSGGWRVAEVRPQRSPAASTASTSRSRNS